MTHPFLRFVIHFIYTPWIYCACFSNTYLFRFNWYIYHFQLSLLSWVCGIQIINHHIHIYKKEWKKKHTNTQKNPFLQLQLTQQKQTAQQRHGKENVHPVATGNWGCGKSTNGDVQLKLVIQWMAASVAGVPELLYYTAGNEKLTKVYTNLFYSYLVNACDFLICINVTIKICSWIQCVVSYWIEIGLSVNWHRQHWLMLRIYLSRLPNIRSGGKNVSSKNWLVYINVKFIYI